VENQEKVIGLILEERAYQEKKWGAKGRSHGMQEWITVLGEWYGKCAGVVRRILFESGDPQAFIRRMVQVAAVALAALEDWGTFLPEHVREESPTGETMTGQIGITEPLLVQDDLSKHNSLREVAAVKNSDKSLEERVTEMLLMAGIPAKIRGYYFIREAITMVVEDPHLINAITKELYPGIAKRYDTTAGKVERSIRTALDVVWNRGNVENINAFYGYEVFPQKNKPTNGEFIATTADRFRMKFKGGDKEGWQQKSVPVHKTASC
jgi:hypothetical protein